MSRILKTRKIPLNLRVRLLEQCIIPVMTYGAQTWTITPAVIEKLQVAQRAMERALLGITLRDRRRNSWIRDKTKMIDIGERIAQLKWDFAGHVARLKDGRWTGKMVQWRPWAERRSRSRPAARWSDDLKKTAGLHWIREAQDRKNWQIKKEAYVKKWTPTG